MKKKGFTLIELLAVLVILAILALITIPIVLSIIKNARENSYARSVETYGRAVETAIMEYQMNNEEEAPNILSAYEVKTSKNKVECNDTIEWVNDSIRLTGCKVKGSNVTFKYENGKATKVEIQQEEQIMYDSYIIGDEITVAGDQYYVIADSDENQDYVTALKANPLTSEEIESAGGNVGYTYNDENATGGIVYGFTSAYAASVIKTVVDTWAESKFKKNELKQGNEDGVRLITYDELTSNLGYDDSSSDPLMPSSQGETPSWLYSVSYNYWTMSPWKNVSNITWIVFGDDGWLVGGNIGNNSYAAVRPVINVYKNKIQN